MSTSTTKFFNNIFAKEYGDARGDLDNMVKSAITRKVEAQKQGIRDNVEKMGVSIDDE